jgi:hypothetical protein
MKAFTFGAAITLAFSAAAYAQAPTWTVPTESQRCPSKWGAADERGSANHQKPAAVMNARGRPRKRHIPDILSRAAEGMLANAKWQNVSWRNGTKGRPKLASPRFACGSPKGLNRHALIP